ncbi:MAG: PP2C family protein-serine/threonine phosphatase [Geminicoccaceae bacterium]
MTAPGHLRATAFTHQGAVRARNEDTIAVADWIASEPMAAPAVFEHALAAPVICLVADGMGGHAAGEVASRAVALHLCRRARQATDEAALAQLLHEANDELSALMDRRPAWYGMGTTVAGVVVAPSGVVVFNVGDSRVYRIDAGALVQLSTDDTPGPKLPDGRTAVDTSSIITQVLGGYGPDAREEQIVPHLVREPPLDGARYLICSDGLTDMLERAAIEALLGDDDPASAQALFQAAMAQGGDDNVSLILLRVRQAA